MHAQRKLHWIMLAVGAAVASTGCQTSLLQPAPTAQTLQGERDAAVAEAGGVRLVADTGEWSGKPQSLDRQMVALQTTIENNSDRTLRLCYEDISLRGDSGLTQHPLPPLKTEGQIVERAPLPPYSARFYHHGFYPSPYFYPYYVGLRAWVYPWRWTVVNPLFYDDYYSYWDRTREVSLPTADMIELGLPEGVIEPGGRVTGFLYFPNPGRETERTTLTARLVDAQTGESFGTISIPFTVGSGA